MHFDHDKNKIQISIFGVSHRLGLLYRGSEVTVGTSEDPLQKYFKGHICSRGIKWNMF